MRLSSRGGRRPRLAFSLGRGTPRGGRAHLDTERWGLRVSGAAAAAGPAPRLREARGHGPGSLGPEQVPVHSAGDRADAPS